MNKDNSQHVIRAWPEQSAEDVRSLNTIVQAETEALEQLGDGSFRVCRCYVQRGREVFFPASKDAASQWLLSNNYVDFPDSLSQEFERLEI